MGQSLDYFELCAEARIESPADDLKYLRLAILADCATQQLLPLLRVLFRRQNLKVEIYEGPFDGIDFDVRNATSAFYQFQPEVVLILNSTQSLRDQFYRRSDPQTFGEDVLRRIAGTWDRLRQGSNAVIVQSTLAAPIERVFGNYEPRAKDSLASTVANLNIALAVESSSRAGVFLLDLEELSSRIGRRFWFDERMWAIGKSLCSLEFLPLVAQNVVDVVLASRGRARKCIVVDLDGTLWGGVVGDDGPHGIKIASHGDGETFSRFQCFLRELKRRGILLAVCSKNEHSNAVQPFQHNEEMVLQLDDFVAFMANWKPKAENIRTIQQMLNIGLDSIVFLDDNPFERAAVRTMLPEVTVPELPEDHAEWVRSLAEMNLFETVSYSKEDTQRSEMYLQEARRKAAVETAVSFEDFLVSLDMRIEVSRFVPEQIDRIVQLLQRSNQFNLTTRRHGQVECEAMMRDVNGCFPLYARLKDKFGDHGLISIVILKPDHASNTLAITDWLMSCRVLARGAEEYLMNYVFTLARDTDLSTVKASYIPTAKNEMVREFYGRFGFQMTAAESSGATHWELDVQSYAPRQVFIQEDAARLYDSAGGKDTALLWNRQLQNS